MGTHLSDLGERRFDFRVALLHRRVKDTRKNRIFLAESVQTYVNHCKYWHGLHTYLAQRLGVVPVIDLLKCKGGHWI